VREKRDCRIFVSLMAVFGPVSVDTVQLFDPACGRS